MNKILITSTDLMMIQFLIPHVNYLSRKGCQITIACSVVGNRIDDVKKAVDSAVEVKVVRLVRNPLKLGNVKGYQDLKKIINEGKYDLVWTNEPVMGVMTRLAARYAAKHYGTKVMYIAHGFHFYKGAPKLNWLACPIEVFMSRFNDALVTINWEDYRWAQRHVHTRQIFHIDGIGVDFSKHNTITSRAKKRAELNVNDDEIMLVSVGELQKRKNHEPMIRAIAQLRNPKIKYFICGKGELKDHLQSLVHSLKLDEQVFFLGYRRDIPDIMNAADIYAHPSLREGLGLASLEAMAAGLPLVTSNVQGIPDYVENGVTGYMSDPMDVKAYAKHVSLLIDNYFLRMEIGNTNKEKAKKYDIKNIEKQIEKIMQDIEDNNEV